MANVANNVLVGVSGGISVADAGTTLPTDATTALSGSYLPAGYVSDAGVTMTVSADTQTIKAWGGDTVRVIQTAHDVQFKYTMIETNDVTQGEYFGSANVTTGLVTIKSGQLPYKVRVLELLDGTAKIRAVLPNSQIVSRGDIVWKTDTEVGYEVTVEAYADATGAKVYLYQDGVPVGSATVAPTITAASPTSTAAAGGALITITGSGFSTVSGAAGVKFGGTNATTYSIVSDNKIVAQAPARPAGSQPITVTNTGGTSNAFAFTYV